VLVWVGWLDLLEWFFLLCLFFCFGDIWGFLLGESFLLLLWGVVVERCGRGGGFYFLFFWFGLLVGVLGFCF